MGIASIEEYASFSGIKRLLWDLDVLILTSLIWFMVRYLRYAFPPLFETLQIEYSISNTEIGFMYSILLFGYAVMQFPAGYVSDRLNERIVITSGTLIFAVGSLLVVVSDPFWSLVVAAGIIGIGTGVHKTVAVNLLSRLYPDRTGLSIGVLDSIGVFGGVIAPLAVAFVLSIAVGWRLLFLAGAFVSVVLAYGFFKVGRANYSPEQEENPEEDALRPGLSYLLIFRHYHFSAFVMVTIAFIFAWTGITAFYPLYLRNVAGFDAGLTGLLYGLLFAISLSQVVSGKLSDMYDSLTMVLISFGLMLLGLIALFFSSGIVSYALTTIVLGFGFHGFRPIRDTYLMEIIPSSIGGGVFGLVRTVMTLIGAGVPALIGFGADTIGLATTFILLPVGTLVGIVFIITMLIVPMPNSEKVSD